jgi:hypothetical protein
MEIVHPTSFAVGLFSALRFLVPQISKLGKMEQISIIEPLAGLSSDSVKS